MELTRDLAIKLHRKLWNWIAEETVKQKRCVTKNEYPAFRRIKVYCCCYMCEYAQDNCMKCAVKWSSPLNGTGKFACMSGGEFGMWRESVLAKNWRKAAKYARKIANLPEREQ